MPRIFLLIAALALSITAQARMLPVVRRALCAAALLPGLALAGPIWIAPVVPYQDESVAGESIREHCAWNQRIVEQVVRRSRGLVALDDGGLAQAGDRTLSMVLTAVNVPQGLEHNTDARLARLHGELRQDGKLIASFEMVEYRPTPFHYAVCDSLNKMAQLIGHDVVEWLRKPVDGAHLGNPDDAPAPADATLDAPAPQ